MSLSNLSAPAPTSIDHDWGDFSILIHALSEPAKRFYVSRGFVESPLESMTLIMTLETVRSILLEFYEKAEIT
jgi:hypothetical protein